MKAVSTRLCPLPRKVFTISELSAASARPPNAIVPSKEIGRLISDDMFRRATNLGKYVRTSLITPNVCVEREVTLVAQRQPCVQAFTRMVKVWKQGCVGQSWCMGYERSLASHRRDQEASFDGISQPVIQST
ncbi:Multiple epidermal growth factor-like domains protein 6 [Liparis tanakae]|uniref:Multiple epidermal growth factor-like domains protein 6 n=1 Tax=Liparis tanakae TaxID=230148 RepID=A0A4Z2HMR8_9TELE|nr:Multiple epidermal growth factor-like domains protein 6 [Liparis tanakae]